LDAPAAAGANGPKDKALEWRSVDWPRVEGDVRRLRQRIFTASREARPRALEACLSRVRG
jgi:RNA-directed DNA polymerase